jgi:hypothetical protein
MTMKRSAEGPYSLVHALYHAGSLALHTSKQFYVGKEKACRNILYMSSSHMSHEFTTLSLDNHVPTLKMTE